MKFRLKSKLDEDQILQDVSAYFGWISPDDQAPFRLISSDESQSGADSEYRGAVLVYLQFKVSQGLKPVTQSSIPRKGSKIDAIRHFRKANGLSDDPTLYFQLRKKAKTAHDLQHNLLLDHHKPPKQYAVYVAPLTLSAIRYGRDLFDSARGRYLRFPFEFEERRVLNRAGISMLRMAPFLRDHVSIAPHEKVKSHNHYYSYSTNGTEIVWHSPEILPIRISRLSDFLYDVLYGLYNGLQVSTPLNVLSEEIGIVSEKVDRTPEGQAENILIRSIQEYGKRLLEKSGIAQFIILQRK